MLDALDAAAVRAAVAAARPDAVIYQATALAGQSDFKLRCQLRPTNRLRTEGIDILLAAAREAGVRRIAAQSYAAHRYARQDGVGQDRGRPAPLTSVSPSPGYRPAVLITGRLIVLEAASIVISLITASVMIAGTGPAHPADVFAVQGTGGLDGRPPGPGPPGDRQGGASAAPGPPSSTSAGRRRCGRTG